MNPKIPGSDKRGHSHPIFARLWVHMAEAGERKGTSPYRDRLLEGLEGEVVEVGAGSGTNF